jgi:transposase
MDQPATIGALPVTVARAYGHQVAYLPGLAMRRIADLNPGRAKTDARDAFIIVDGARSQPHTLRPVDVNDEALAEWDVLVGFDDDLTGEATRISNRIRGLLTGIHPALSRPTTRVPATPRLGPNVEIIPADPQTKDALGNEPQCERLDHRFAPNQDLLLFEESWSSHSRA